MKQPWCVQTLNGSWHALVEQKYIGSMSNGADVLCGRLFGSHMIPLRKAFEVLMGGVVPQRREPQCPKCREAS